MILMCLQVVNKRSLSLSLSLSLDYNTLRRMQLAHGVMTSLTKEVCGREQKADGEKENRERGRRGHVELMFPRH